MNESAELGSAFAPEENQSITLNGNVALGKYDPNVDLSGTDVDDSEFTNENNSSSIEASAYSEEVSPKSDDSKFVTQKTPKISSSTYSSETSDKANPNKPFVDLFRNIIVAWSDLLRSLFNRTFSTAIFTKNNNFYYIIMSLVVIFALSILIDYVIGDNRTGGYKPTTLVDHQTGAKYILSSV